MQDVNLIDPIPAYQQEQRIRWFKCSIALLIIVLMGLISATGFQAFHIFISYMHEKKLNTALHQHAPTMQSIQKIRALEATLKQFDDTCRQNSQPSSPYILLQKIADHIPSDIYIQHFNYVLSKQHLSLEGISFSFQSIHTFVDFLTNIPGISTCNLISLQQEKSSFKNNESMIRFTLHISFN